MMDDALDLRTAVFDVLGDSSRADHWPRMVTMAEKRLNQTLRTNDQVTDTNVTVSGGSATLPTDFLEMIRVGTATRPYRELSTADYLSTGHYDYAIQGSSMLVTAEDGTLAIKYYAGLPTLASSLTATNWLLGLAPEVYLYATLCEALIADPEAKAVSEGHLQRALRGLRTISDRNRFGNSTVRVCAV